MEEQFNKESKEGWRFAAEAARITDERASSEDQKTLIRRCFCGSGQQSGSSCWRRRKEQLHQSQEERVALPRFG